MDDPLVAAADTVLPAGALPQPWLDQLPAAAAARLRELGIRRGYERAEVLMHPGDSGDGIAIVVSGVVATSVAAGNGVTAVTGLRAAGDVLGESAIAGGPRHYTATTLTPTIVFVIATSNFLRFIKDHPDAALALARWEILQAKLADQWRVEAAAYPVKVRLARRLLELTNRFGYVGNDGQLELGIPLTQDDLARFIDCSELAVHLAIRELREAGIIGVSYRSIRILDASALSSAGELSSAGGKAPSPSPVVVNAGVDPSVDQEEYAADGTAGPVDAIADVEHRDADPVAARVVDPPGTPSGWLRRLSPMEKALLERLATGSTISSAAAAEFLSLRTVNRRITELRRRVGAPTTRELVAMYRRESGKVVAP